MNELQFTYQDGEMEQQELSFEEISEFLDLIDNEDIDLSDATNIEAEIHYSGDTTSMEFEDAEELVEYCRELVQ